MREVREGSRGMESNSRIYFYNGGRYSQLMLSV